MYIYIYMNTYAIHICIYTYNKWGVMWMRHGGIMLSDRPRETINNLNLYCKKWHNEHVYIIPNKSFLQVNTEPDVLFSFFSDVRIQFLKVFI